MYSLDNIYKSFDNNQVLKGVSLEIPKNILAWTYHSHNFVTGEKSWDHMHT